MLMRLKPWQVGVLVAPIAIIVGFVLVAAGQQIRAWHLNWIWAVFIFMLLGWRWLLVRWTRPAIAQAEALVSEVNAELEAAAQDSVALIAAIDGNASSAAQVEAALVEVLQAAQDDPPVWDDWGQFWRRCTTLVTLISKAYHPEVKRPLLNIYVPEAYGLIRGTVDDTDRMMQKLSPVLSQISIGQMVEGVELYQRLEPSARKLIKAFNWAQWGLNPAAAIAKTTSSKYMDRANQQILMNLSNMLRETALRNLAQQAVALYGGGAKVALDEVSVALPAVAEAKTQTLREILEQAQPTETVAQKPVSLLLVGRTGAGKSSVINTLFQSEKAAVDVLPSTDKIQSYRWEARGLGGEAKEALILWDTPGYEQVARGDFREQVLAHASEADLLLLVTPALDPALQVDADFLRDMQSEVSDLKVIALVTQVDRLRPVREWSPPYHWRTGSWPKETSIREAVNYRAEQLGDYCQAVLPLVTQSDQRTAWGDDDLAKALMSAIEPTKQLRLARFLRSREAQSAAAAKIIDRYTFQMTTTEGLTKLLKSPILQFLSTLTTGNPSLGMVLTEKIPVEDLPIVLGKLQMAYDLFSLFSEGGLRSASFDLLALWPLLLRNEGRFSSVSSITPDKTAWAFGHALVEYWTQGVSADQLSERIDFYLDKKM